MTQTITVVNQVIFDHCDSQQNPNYVADQSAPALVSAILENNDSSASQLITEPLADNSPNNELSKRSTEPLLGEQLIDAQLANTQAELPHAASNTQGSIVQSTQSYTLTATSSWSLTTTVRDSSPRLEEVLDQEWHEDNPMSESPSTHEKSPDYSFGEQLEQSTKTHMLPSRPIEESFIWETEGVTNEEAEKLVQNRTNKVPTNADCITYLYDYTEVDDPKIKDHIYYRRCKRPTNFEEVYRRHKFRIRRREYFARPAIKIGGIWYPEPYLPDPEDPEWSWKEGIEMDQPAQSLF